MAIEQSVKEFAFISYSLFSHNYSDSCASAPFHRLLSALVSHSWYASHVRDISLELIKEENPDNSYVVETWILNVPQPPASQAC